MREHARTFLLTLHGFGLIACLALWAHSSLLLPLHASMRVTDLDRADVIDNQKLIAARPELAENARFKVARYIAGTAEERAVAAAQVGACVSAIGLLATLFLPHRRRVESSDARVQSSTSTDVSVATEPPRADLPTR